MSLRLLHFEDSVEDAELIQASLEDAGLAVAIVRAQSSHTYLSALSAQRFDLILSDFNIPGFEGTAALSAARKTCPLTPFIFVTGALGDEKAIELLKRGADDYVLKDRLERLGPSVRRALNEAREKTERLEAEAALRESERTLTTLIGNMPGMAFRSLPVPHSHFEYASRGVVELTGYGPEAFAPGGPLTWSAVIHPDDAPRVAEEAAAAFEKREQVTTTYRIRTRAGAQKWVWHRSVGIYDVAGKLVAIEGFVTDITREKEAEAEAQQRAEFEKHLIGIVSHDLRNPLNAILLAASTGLRSETLDPKVMRSLVRIQASGERAARMITDLLDFTQARLGGGIHIEREPVSLDTVVNPVVEEMQTTHPGREIRVEHEGEPHGEWDPDRLAQALSNLLVNALRYSPDTSRVTVRTRPANGGGARIDVHNLGTPISAELKQRLFQPMQRGVKGDAANRSVGLGLYIVDQIARAHGGSVEVHSTADDGTTFTLILPT